MTKKKLKKKFFSIITVVKNDQTNIGKTIKSVLSQNFKNFEYIIIDGKSNDRTLKIINKFGRKISYILSEKDNTNIADKYDIKNPPIFIAPVRAIF